MPVLVYSQQDGSALTDEGILGRGVGATQLNDLSSYYNNMGLNTDGEFTEEVKSARAD